MRAIPLRAACRSGAGGALVEKLHPIREKVVESVGRRGKVLCTAFFGGVSFAVTSNISVSIFVLAML